MASLTSNVSKLTLEESSGVSTVTTPKTATMEDSTLGKKEPTSSQKPAANQETTNTSSTNSTPVEPSPTSEEPSPTLVEPSPGTEQPPTIEQDTDTNNNANYNDDDSTDSDDEGAGIYDEIPLSDMKFEKDEGKYTYPCPCGDLFEIYLEDLDDGEDLAYCPSCSLKIKVEDDR